MFYFSLLINATLNNVHAHNIDNLQEINIISLYRKYETYLSVVIQRLPKFFFNCW